MLESAQLKPAKRLEPEDQLKGITERSRGVPEGGETPSDRARIAPVGVTMVAVSRCKTSDHANICRSAMERCPSRNLLRE